MLRYSLLGPLRVEQGHGKSLRQIEITPPFAKKVLAILLLNRGTTVSVDRIADSVWGWDPPASSRHAIQAAVSTLRKTLGSTEIATVGGGYRMDAPEVDIDQAAALAVEASSIIADQPNEALELLDACLSLWRGEPLFDVAYDEWAQPEIRRLDELRVGALVDRASARISLGCCNEVVGDLEALVMHYPSRERVWALLVVALCKTGRRGDAISALRSASEILETEWGLQPSAELRHLEEMVIAGDAALDGPWIEPLVRR